MTPQPPDYSAWKFWVDIAQLVGILIIGLYTWWSNRNKATNKRFAGLEKRMTAAESDNQKLAEKVDSRPPCSHHKSFDDRLLKVQQGIANIDGRMEGVGKGLDIIQQHLMSKGS